MTKDFASVATSTKYYDEEVIDLIGAKLDNYYHWMAEGLSRFGLIDRLGCKYLR